MDCFSNFYPMLTIQNQYYINGKSQFHPFKIILLTSFRMSIPLKLLNEEDVFKHRESLTIHSSLVNYATGKVKEPIPNYMIDKVKFKAY
jgi:hypothetical protein